MIAYLPLVIDKLAGWTFSWELASIASWGTPPVALANWHDEKLASDCMKTGIRLQAGARRQSRYHTYYWTIMRHHDERRTKRGGGRDLGKRVTSFAWWWCDKLVVWTCSFH